MGVGEHPGGMIDAEFVDEVRRRFVEKFLKAFAEVSGGAVGEFLHAFNASLEIFLLAHGCAERFKPFGNLRLTEEVDFVDKKLGIQLAEEYFNFEATRQGRVGRGVEFQESRVKRSCVGRIELEASGEDGRGHLLEEGIVSQILAQRECEIEIEIKHDNFNLLEFAIGGKPVNVIGSQKTDIACRQMLMFSIDAVNHAAVVNQENLDKVMGMEHRPGIRNLIEVEIAASLHRLELSRLRPGDFMAGDARFADLVEPVFAVLLVFIHELS